MESDTSIQDNPPSSSISQPQYPILILSDVHYGHPLGKLRDLNALRPLLDGVKTLVINGDFTEARQGANLSDALDRVQSLKNRCADWGVELIMLTGNHDGTLYKNHWISLAEDRVLVTHGDCLYWDVAPWSPEIEEYREVWQAHHGAWYLAAARGWDALLAYTRARTTDVRDCGDHFARGSGGTLRSIWRLASKPLRILRLLKVWATSHRIAERIVRRLSPKTKFFLYGHTHHSLIRNVRGLQVINTGAWHACAITRIVRIDDEKLSVGKVEMKGETPQVTWEKEFPL